MLLRPLSRTHHSLPTPSSSLPTVLAWHEFQKFSPCCSQIHSILCFVQTSFFFIFALCPPSSNSSSPSDGVCCSQRFFLYSFLHWPGLSRPQCSFAPKTQNRTVDVAHRLRVPVIAHVEPRDKCGACRGYPLEHGDQDRNGNAGPHLRRPPPQLLKTKMR